MNWLSRIGGAKSRAARAPDADALDAWLREGFDLQSRGELDGAQALYRKVLEHDPCCPEALFFLGAIAVHDRRELEAIQLFEQAHEARPDDATILFALGATHFALGQMPLALTAFRACLAMQPDWDDIYSNLCTVLLEVGQEQEALELMEGAVASGRHGTHMNANLGGIYKNHGRIAESVAAYRKVLEHAPDDADNYSNLLFTLNYSSDIDAASLYAEHRKYAARFARPHLAPPTDRSWPRRLRIGYVSPDFRTHVVAVFAEPILEQRDRDRFEVFCYFNHPHADRVTERLQALADGWVDCIHMSDAELADRIRADHIDILVDLAGHTGHNRLPVFAMKPAPVQVSYLGYPNTTGLKTIDFRITDARADPPGEADRTHSEQLVRMPRCFICYRPPPTTAEVVPPPMLTTGQVTFGCFNNLAKISDPFLDAAAKILLAVPDSRLHLKSKSLDVPSVAARIRARFAQSGVDVARVVFVGWKSSVGDHLSAYGALDIALDSFPYNGTTTTCEALWMGVPVVTFAGARHAARVGASLLHSIGLGELVAEDVEGYVALCAALAKDPGRLAELRAGMRERLRRSPLMDEPAFVEDLERCYLTMWQSRLDAAAESAPAVDVAAVLGRAAELRQAGGLADAARLYERILEAKPDQLDALSALWDVSYETGNPGAAIDWLNRALLANADLAAVHYMLGCSLQAQRRYQDAIASFARTLELDPAHARAHNNLGCTLEAAGDVQAALENYRRAVELSPSLAVAHYNIGNVYRQAGDPQQAIAHFRDAIAIEPGHAEWHSNLGLALYERLQLDEAESSYRRALAIDADQVRGLNGLGLALVALGRPGEAEDCFRRAIALDAGAVQAHSNLLLALHYTRGDDGAVVFGEHAAWAERHARGKVRVAARSDAERRRRGRLKIGYVSPDFAHHPVADFIEPVLASHDRSQFHVFAYSCGLREDGRTRQLRGLCETWRDAGQLSDDALMDRIRADRIDILVDLAGHTGGGRLLLFARKAAPVQVSWLGYPATTGLRTMDYRITDARADPPEETEAIYSERLVRLDPGFSCYRPASDAPLPGEPPSLASGHVTFGCFNNLAKVSHRMVVLWARLLAALPGSRMVLKAYGLSAQSARSDFAARFAAQGIGPERLSLLGPDESAAGHLLRYGEIDVALDVYPYNGVTTTCEALWMGVPVVTLAGRTHVARTGASILHRAGLGDLVCADPDAYLARALELAADLERRRRLRRDLQAMLEASPLLDANGFTRDLERAYRDMWAAYTAPAMAAAG